MSKTGAILGCVVTALLAAFGLATYSGGRGTMEWFGVRLSPVAFIIVIVIFAVFDFFNVRAAFSAEKKFRQTQQELEARAAEIAAASRPLDRPCRIQVTRRASAIGAAMGVEVYLNGRMQDLLKNGQTVTMETSVEDNLLTVHYKADNATRSEEFTAVPGGIIRYELKYSGAVLTRLE